MSVFAIVLQISARSRGGNERRHTEPNLDPKANKQPTQSGVFVGFQTGRGGRRHNFPNRPPSDLARISNAPSRSQIPDWLKAAAYFWSIFGDKLNQIPNLFANKLWTTISSLFVVVFNRCWCLNFLKNESHLPFLCQKKCAFSDWISPESNHRPVRNKWKVIFIAGSNELFLRFFFFIFSSCRPKNFPSTSCWVVFWFRVFPRVLPPLNY